MIYGAGVPLEEEEEEPVTGTRDQPIKVGILA
jgi:hypothetical protein